MSIENKRIMEECVYTVTEINNFIKDIVNNTLNEPIQVTGEVSNVKKSNGHLYATLKDNDSAINIISWGFAKYNIDIKNGDKIVAEGKVTCYIKSGSYNLTVNKVKHVGTGDLHNIYDVTKQKCEEKGYFEITRKKKQPSTINRIGILTAYEGAALQDVLYVLKKNNFFGTVIIKKCTVQGQNCPQSVIDGLKYLDQWQDSNNNKLDVILVTRGGGSFEDLMGFSNFEVVKQIFETKIFTISAIGHEIDNMLSDYVADLRAPTPSVAAELISKQQRNIIEKFNTDKLFFESHVKYIIDSELNKQATRLKLCQYKLKDPTSDINEDFKKLEDIKNIFETLITKRLDKCSDKIKEIEHLLEHRNVDKMLETGYVLLLNRGYIYDSVASIKENQKLKLKFRDGEATITINTIT